MIRNIRMNGTITLHIGRNDNMYLIRIGKQDTSTTINSDVYLDMTVYSQSQ